MKKKISLRQKKNKKERLIGANLASMLARARTCILFLYRMRTCRGSGCSGCNVPGGVHEKYALECLLRKRDIIDRSSIFGRRVQRVLWTGQERCKCRIKTDGTRGGVQRAPWWTTFHSRQDGWLTYEPCMGVVGGTDWAGRAVENRYANQHAVFPGPC